MKREGPRPNGVKAIAQEKLSPKQFRGGARRRSAPRYPLADQESWFPERIISDGVRIDGRGP